MSKNITRWVKSAQSAEPIFLTPALLMGVQRATPASSCRFNNEAELMEAWLIKGLKPSLNIKPNHSH